MILSEEKRDELFRILESCEAEIIANHEDPSTDEFAKRYIDLKIAYRPQPEEGSWDAEISATAKLAPKRMPMDLKRDGKRFVSI